MARFVALLRGINVGGKHKLPMADLRALFTDAGAHAVETYIQSGNVVFEASAREGPKLAATVAANIEASMGFRAPIVVRTAKAWQALVDGNPFADEAEADPKRVHAAVLDRKPAAAARKAFDPDCRLGERWILDGGTLYIDFAGGVARSKVTVAYIDRVLGCIATGRNWRTVLALHERVCG